MRHTAMLVFLVPAAAIAQSVVPISGDQRMSGLAICRWATSPPQTVSNDFSLVAPTPTSGWLPPDQVAQTSAFSATAEAQATFRSFILPGQVSFDTTIHGSAARQVIIAPANGSEFDAQEHFLLRFSVDQPLQCDIAASLTKISYGWPSAYPSTMSLEMEGGGQIFSLINDGPYAPFPVVQSFPLTRLVLVPGTYLLQASDRQGWQAGQTGMFDSSMHFSLQVVPSPSPIAVLGLAAIAARRQRRGGKGVVS